MGVSDESTNAHYVDHIISHVEMIRQGPAEIRRARGCLV
ncbi:MAG: hypothetical protein QOF98_3586 [Streptomyces sp.]|jgi:hypothetical protein|nr:hypothetical protein [Streptomyces sp.]